MTQQELKAKYYPLYMECKVAYSNFMGIPTKATLDFNNISTLIYGFDTQLILTPLSEITDEDAIEVAKIYVSYEWDTIIGTDTNYHYKNIEDKEGNKLSLFKDLSYSLNDSSGDYWMKSNVIDFLRSKGYDCDNLIEQGIAIAKTK